MKRRLFNKIILTAAIALTSITIFAAPIKIACVGDSITEGVGVRDRSTQAYPAQLQEMLGDEYKLMNCGTSGIQMNNYLPRWQDKIKAFQPDIVTIKLGTNDTKGRKHNDPDNKAAFDKRYKDSTLKVLEFLNGLESKPKIFLCYPVPVFQDKWGINEKSITEDIIPAITAIAKEKDLPIIDLYKAIEGKGNLVPDGIHPNEVAHKILAETIAASIKANAKPAEPEIRTWTDSAGNELEAKLIKATRSQVVLETAEGKQMKLSPSNLIKADKDYIKQVSAALKKKQ
jgi:acyl-CoA thioesterase-1